jgi:pectate lyase
MNGMSSIHSIRNFGLFVFAGLAFFSPELHAQEGCASFGWANYEGQVEKGPVTGGGNSAPVEVTTFAALKSAVESSDAKVIHVMNDVGNGYKGTTGDVLNFKSNKTVMGVKPGITVKSSFQINGASNIIVQNLIIRGPGNSNSEQNWDAVNIQQGANRIWFDHCTVMEGEDGNFDVVKGADNVTATWCKFTYVTGGEHNFSNLVGSSDTETQSHGKLNITYAYCWWDNVNSRCPRTRYGKIHVLNSYYNKVGSGAYAGKMSNIRLEGSFFESNVTNPTGLISTQGEAGVFAIDCNRGSTQTDGYNTPFQPPYPYKKYSNSEVKALVTQKAGATLADPRSCMDVVATSTQFSNPQNAPLFSWSSPDILNLEFNLVRQGDIQLSIVDLAGKKMMASDRINFPAGRANTTLDIKTLHSGAYVLNIFTQDQNVTKRIIRK